MEGKKVFEYAIYRFSDEEKAIIAGSLAQATQSFTELNERKKQVDAELKGQIEARQAEINREARRYNNGYEYRDVECSVEFHVPAVGRKKIVRLDTGELLRECAMDSSELQQNLFEEAPEA